MTSWIGALVALALAGGALAGQAKSNVEDLGGGRYRIGAIEVDKPARRLTVPGTALELASPEAPVEFIAVTRGSLRSYEALIELDADAVDFNLACILIGLDKDHARIPAYHFDPQPVTGDRVTGTLVWTRDGAEVTAGFADLVQARGTAPAGPHEWVYTGSFFHNDGSYAAEALGVLISVVHDPESIVHHRAGLGLGDYGAVTADPDKSPPAGQRVRLTLRAL